MNTSMTTTSDNKSESNQNISTVGQKSCTSQFTESVDQETVTKLNNELQISEETENIQSILHEKDFERGSTKEESIILVQKNELVEFQMSSNKSLKSLKKLRKHQQKHEVQFVQKAQQNTLYLCYSENCQESFKTRKQLRLHQKLSHIKNQKENLEEIDTKLQDPINTEKAIFNDDLDLHCNEISEYDQNLTQIQSIQDVPDPQENEMNNILQNQPKEIAKKDATETKYKNKIEEKTKLNKYQKKQTVIGKKRTYSMRTDLNDLNDEQQVNGPTLEAHEQTSRNNGIVESLIKMNETLCQNISMIMQMPDDNTHHQTQFLYNQNHHNQYDEMINNIYDREEQNYNQNEQMEIESNHTSDILSFCQTSEKTQLIESKAQESQVRDKQQFYSNILKSVQNDHKYTSKEKQILQKRQGKFKNLTDQQILIILKPENRKIIEGFPLKQQVEYFKKMKEFSGTILKENQIQSIEKWFYEKNKSSEGSKKTNEGGLNDKYEHLNNIMVFKNN